MRLISYSASSGPRIAARRPDDSYVDLSSADPSLPTDMTDLLMLGPAGLKRAQATLATGKPLEPTSIKLLPPVPRPEKIFCIGLNYADHIAESKMETPANQVWFSKASTSTNGVRCRKSRPIPT